VQLKKERVGQVCENIATFSASLLAATIATHAGKAMAQTQSPDSQNSTIRTFGPGITYYELNGAMLVYQEPGGRVTAIEPTVNYTAHGPIGQEFSLGFVYDVVSGATPNGAVPSDQTQTFVTPIKASGSGGTATVTSASGGSTIIQLPPSPGQIATAALGRQYTVGPNVLPMDKGFRDRREAFTFDYSQPLGAISEVGLGGGYSLERDYQAISGNLRIAQNFNTDNTTVSLAVNTELDSSFPYGGVPTPLTAMSADWKTISSRSKTQVGAVLGITEVISRRWLMQFDYSYDAQSGYQNDPYRVISVVDPVSGEPTSSLYENRPNNRQSQSLFWDNKFDFDPFVTDLSVRAFKDSWGISSITAELSERVSLTRSMYIEPNVRWYQQSSANFFENFLVGGQPLPIYASSDTRLEKFTGLTFGMKIGVNLTGSTELYLRGDYYKQTGDGHPADAIGQLKQQNLFAGTDAAFVMLGYSWKFR
jgi:hypothetical protein